MTQHASQHDKSIFDWRRPNATPSSFNWRTVALSIALALSATAAQARPHATMGTDGVHPSVTGGYEGGARSTHDHGVNGFFSYPGNFYEGSGPRNDYGHSGEARRFGHHADASGHSSAGYLVQRNFLPGGYSSPDHRLFHYRSACYGEH